MNKNSDIVKSINGLKEFFKQDNEYCNDVGIVIEFLLNHIEGITDPIYCPVCGACGHTGCCNPDMCKCLYKDEYKDDWAETDRENTMLWEKLQNIRKLSNTYVKFGEDDDTT